jgi:hypothetical protein
VALWRPWGRALPGHKASRGPLKYHFNTPRTQVPYLRYSFCLMNLKTRTVGPLAVAGASAVNCFPLRCVRPAPSPGYTWVYPFPGIPKKRAHPRPRSTWVPDLTKSLATLGYATEPPGRKQLICCRSKRPPPTAKQIGKGGGEAPHLFQWVLR